MRSAWASETAAREPATWAAADWISGRQARAEAIRASSPATRSNWGERRSPPASARAAYSGTPICSLSFCGRRHGLPPCGLELLRGRLALDFRDQYVGCGGLVGLHLPPQDFDQPAVEGQQLRGHSELSLAVHGRLRAHDRSPPGWIVPPGGCSIEFGRRMLAIAVRYAVRPPNSTG